ncbi:MAG TPA: hypothetical protein VGP72_31200 [Planctomycetota bacterium]|jgi:hypothetical protein
MQEYSVGFRRFGELALSIGESVINDELVTGAFGHSAESVPFLTLVSKKSPIRGVFPSLAVSHYNIMTYMLFMSEKATSDNTYFQHSSHFTYEKRRSFPFGRFQKLCRFTYENRRSFRLCWVLGGFAQSPWVI